MTFQPLEAEVIYGLMIAGLIFTLAGLYFMFKPRDGETPARIELFGLKFQASSAGTLVFLIGAGFLLLPLVTPKATPQAGTVPRPANDATLPPSLSNQTASDAPSTQLAVLLPTSADAAESEPNDQITQANQFQLGFGAKGTLDRDREDFADWFVVDTSSATSPDFTVQVRTPNGGCRLVAYDQDEEQLDSIYCNANGGSRNLEIFAKDNAVIYLRLSFNGGSAAKQVDYEVFLRQ